MKNVLLFIWNSGENEGTPFGIFDSHEEAHTEIEKLAMSISKTTEDLKGDLYIYELTVNKVATHLIK